MQYATPKDDSSALSLPERTFLRRSARGVLSSRGSILRLDGRAPSEPRPVRLAFSRRHNRSECVVRLGSGTRGAASVRAELCPPPNADRPNDGQVKFGVDVGPMGRMGYEVVERAASNYAGGDGADGGGGGGGGGGDAPYVQRLKANRILRILERTLLIGGAMDAEALCVRSGAWVWRLHVDVSLLDDGGNAVDACVLAAVAALRHYRLPEVSVGGGDGGGDDVGDDGGYQEATVIHSDDREPAPLPLHHTPLTATFALFADETGSSTAVSALLDPSDREELACDGLLTWGYNKYGEMCCLDFPGGCELRPRQLMASARLGERRCVEVCEMLEAALGEAEGKAQEERMARLKALEAGRASKGEAAAAASSDAEAPEDPSDAAARGEEEEEYRQRALDYGTGHFAASVKEDKEEKPARRGKKETSSLFHAILRSAQSNAMDAAGVDEGETTAGGAGTNQEPRKEAAVVEIVSHRGESLEGAVAGNTESVEEEKEDEPMRPPQMSDSDEEEVVELASEFSAAPKEDEGSAIPNAQTGGSATSMEVDSVAKADGEARAAASSLSGNDSARAEKRSSSGVKPKSKPSEEDEITDLTQAVKKKKKSKKSKKK
ncbi:hypothetical protein ACHAWF_012962 [Thalassiosira exigua]